MSLSLPESFERTETNIYAPSTTNNNQYTTSADIKYLNYQKAVLHLPTVIFLGMLSIVGFVGNVLVLYSYIWKIRPSNHRVFIIFSAVIDLTVCAIGIPFRIYEHTYPLMQREKWVCKISVTISYSMVVSSIVILLVIAIERYRKVCKPLEKQMSIFQAKAICVIVMAVSGGATLPLTGIFGLKTVQTDIDGLTGTRCFVDDAYADTNYFVYISLFSFILVFLILAILSVLYYFVSQKIRQHITKMNICNEKRVKTEGHRMDKTLSRMLNDKQNIDPIQENNTSSGKNTSSNHEEIEERKTSKHNIQDDQRNGKTYQSSRRTTVMLFTISVVFFVSYFPHIILQLILSLHNDFEQNLSKIQYSIYDFFNWSFFINNMANPIIYGICDKRFISQVKNICHIRVH